MSEHKPFKLFIDSAAKTKKEIEEEVKRLIRSRINNVVEDAIRDTKDSTEKIPPRENIYYGRKPQTSSHLSADELAYAPESPDSSSPDLTDKIRAMRELGQTFYNGYMLRQCAELTMVKQGEFMQDVTDDFGRSAFCAIDRPVYGALSLEQLRTYFTWRTDARKGTYYKTDRPYVVLYCYELLNKIGVLSSADAFNRLVDVWENCRSFCPYLDSVMPFWLRDLYAYSDISEDFMELEKCFPVQSEHSDEITSQFIEKNYHGKLDYLMARSSYNLKGSIFLSDETRDMFDEALADVLIALDEYFGKYDITLFELVCGRTKKDHSWSPFAGAYVDRERMDGFRACRISPTERYCVKRGQPCHERFEHAPYRSFIGYVLKSTESVLRERTGFRYSIVPNLSLVLDDFCNRDRLFKAASDPEFAAVIPNAVNKWCDEHGIYPKPKERKRKKKPDYEDELPPEYGQPYAAAPVVEIDVANLDKIRQEAEETARKLIIEEELQDSPPADEIARMTARIEDAVFEEQTIHIAKEVYSQYDFSALDEGWRQLAESMEAQQLELIKALSTGRADEFCREHGMLPESAFEELNAIALEHIGDCLVEYGELIPDYADDVAKIASLIK